ncbi:GntR family transcriptional regulator, partial [Burkholderia pseudomallei]
DFATVRRGTLEHLEIYADIDARDSETARRLMWNHVIDGTPDRIRLIRARYDTGQ